MVPSAAAAVDVVVVVVVVVVVGHFVVEPEQIPDIGLFMILFYAIM